MTAWCVDERCPVRNKRVQVMITDLCPECKEGEWSRGVAVVVGDCGCWLRGLAVWSGWVISVLPPSLPRNQARANQPKP